MGCDIHLFAEVKKKKNLIDWLLFWRKPQWRSIDNWELDKDCDPPRISVPYDKRFYKGGRNYNLFAALCGVRANHFYDEVNPVSEPKDLPIDVSKEVKNESDDWGSDGHSHSWNTLQELEKYDWQPWGETCDFFRFETLSKLRSSGSPDKVRVVYWFDN